MGRKQILKSGLTFAIFVAASALIIGCNKNDGGNNPGPGNNGGGAIIADIPPGPNPTQCLQTYSYQPNQPEYKRIWGPYSRQRIRPYAWNRRSRGGRFHDIAGLDLEQHRFSHPPDANTNSDDENTDPDDGSGDDQGAPPVVNRGHSNNDSNAPPIVNGGGNNPPPVINNAPGGAPGNGTGFGPIPQSYPSNNQGQLCGCQAMENTVPACGPQGLTCVPVQGQTPMLANWTYNNGAFNFANYGYSTYGFQNQNNGCATTVAQICQVPGQFFGGAYCQPVGGGTTYGIWVQRPQ